MRPANHHLAADSSRLFQGRRRHANESVRRPEYNGENYSYRPCRQAPPPSHVSFDAGKSTGDEINTEEDTEEDTQTTAAKSMNAKKPTSNAQKSGPIRKNDSSKVRSSVHENDNDDDVLFVSNHNEEVEQDTGPKMTEVQRIKYQGEAKIKSLKNRPEAPPGKTGFEPMIAKMNAKISKNKPVQVKQESEYENQDSEESEEDKEPATKRARRFKSKPKGGYGKGTKRWEMNKEPVLIDPKSRSTSWKLKRGVLEDELDGKVHNGHQGRSGKGLNDPNNILIVHYKDNEKKSFKEIAVLINARLVKDGKLPKFTANNMNVRYNRTAPRIKLLENGKWRRLVDRPGMTRGQVGAHKPNQTEEELAGWTEELNIKMVRFCHQYELQKWEAVSKYMREEITDDEHPEWPSAMECANRYHHI